MIYRFTRIFIIILNNTNNFMKQSLQIKMIIMVIGLFIISPTITNAQTWTGTTDTDWFTSTNWSTGIVPTTSDNVAIPNVANAPTISGGTAFAKHIQVNAGATLIINNGATLTIDNSNSGSSRNHSLLVSGAVNNAGTIHISNSAENGIYNITTSSSITNSGTINVNSTALDGFLNIGTFTNQSGGVFNIGTTGGAGNIISIGIRNRGTFDNQNGGTLTISNVNSAEAAVTTTSSISFNNSGTFNILNTTGTRGFRHTTGTFTNTATGIINVGDASNPVAGVGLLMDEPFTNQGTINIENVGTIGLQTRGGSGETSENYGIININTTGGDGFFITVHKNFRESFKSSLKYWNKYN
jgi:hypothetical protein